MVGAGTMGNGIAHVFAQHGWEVALIDSAAAALDRATTTIKGNLERQVKKGTLPADATAADTGAHQHRVEAGRGGGRPRSSSRPPARTRR